MRKAKPILVGLSLLTALRLGAVELTNDEEKLQRMQASRAVDGEHRAKAQEELNANIGQLAEHEDQRDRRAASLKSAQEQIIPARTREKSAKESYKDAVKEDGQGSAKSRRAKSNLDDARQSHRALVKTRDDLQGDVGPGERRVHNDKTIISQQKQLISNDSRYISADDRDIKKKQTQIKNKNIEDLKQ